MKEDGKLMSKMSKINDENHNYPELRITYKHIFYRHMNDLEK